MIFWQCEEPGGREVQVVLLDLENRVDSLGLRLRGFRV